MIESSQQAMLVAFSLFGIETAEINEFGEFLTNSRCMKIIFPSLLIAAVCKRPPKSAIGFEFIDKECNYNRNEPKLELIFDIDYLLLKIQ